MKTSWSLSACVTLALALLLALTMTLPAASSKPKKKTPTPPTDTRILVESVSASDNTVTIKDMSNSSTQTYKVDFATKITVNGNPGKLSDITSGLQVRDLVERDSQTLDSISVSPADPAPKSPDASSK